MVKFGGGTANKKVPRIWESWRVEEKASSGPYRAVCFDVFIDSR